MKRCTFYAYKFVKFCYLTELFKVARVQTKQPLNHGTLRSGADHRSSVYLPCFTSREREKDPTGYLHRVIEFRENPMAVAKYFAYRSRATFASRIDAKRNPLLLARDNIREVCRPCDVDWSFSIRSSPQNFENAWCSGQD